MKINLQNNVGAVKNVKVGFSWTMFFFGFFVPLFRGDMKWALITFLLGVVTAGFASLVLAFLYNSLYIKDLLAAGYRPVDENARVVLQSKGFFIPA